MRHSEGAIRGDQPPFRRADRPLVDRYRTGLFDLDGVVYRGSRPIPHAATTLAAAARRGMGQVFLTNNSSRTPGEVASILGGIGIAAHEGQIVTSAEAAAQIAAERLPRGARVLVVGGGAVEDALRRRGLTPVRSRDAEPAAVVQGFAPEVDWRQLAEASYAVARGILWIASDMDLRVSREHGIAPGNGTLVNAVGTATGHEPVVAGKPDVAIFVEAARRSPGPYLVVGDGLTTDIEGARRVGFDSALVLTGVTTVRRLLDAPPSTRPTYLLGDLRDMMSPRPAVRPRRDGFACGRWFARHDGDEVVLVDGLDGRRMNAGLPDTADLDGVRALCRAVWTARDSGHSAEVSRRTQRVLDRYLQAAHP